MKSFADGHRHESVDESGQAAGRRGSVRAEVASAVAGFSASQSLGAFLSTLGLGDCPSRPERVMVIGGRIAWKKTTSRFPSPGGMFMNGFIRHAAVAGALALGLSVGATDGLAQSNSNATNKDLSVEAVPPPHWQAPPHGRPARPPHWQAPAPHWRPAQVPLARPVQASLMTVGPSILSIGDPLGFRMASLACEGYGQLYVLSASGRSQLWLENVRMHTGQPIYFPSPGSVVRATPPAGDETILFVVTRAPIHGFVGGTSMTPFDLQYTHDGLRAAIQERLAAMPRSDWAVAEVSVRVQE
jgi:hypothetical protein